MKATNLSFDELIATLAEEALRRVLDGHTRRQRALAIGVSGPSCCGKTTLSRNLCKVLEELGNSASYFPLDGFLLPRDERIAAGLSGYDPRSTRAGEMVDTLRALLLEERSVLVPLYCHETGCVLRPGERVEPADIIVLDGIASLGNAVWEHFDVEGLFFHVPKEQAIERRTEIEVRERAFSEAKSRGRAETEWRAYSEFVVPRMRRARLVLEVGATWDSFDLHENAADRNPR